MFANSNKGWLCAVAAIAIVASGASAAEILIVDLTVPNQVTITATDGLCEVDATGNDVKGVYFENFYGVAGSALSDSLVFGDLTNAENPADNSPDLYRHGDGDDPGLNLWSFSSDYDISFSAGQVAFVGTATWDLSPVEFEEMKSGAHGGNIYFPADRADDVATADLLGTYSVIVPEPATLSLMGLVIGVGALRRRR